MDRESVDRGAGPGCVRWVDTATLLEVAGESVLHVVVERVARRRAVVSRKRSTTRSSASCTHATPRRQGIGATRDADANLSDQLFRARQVGVPRLVLTLT